MMTRTLYFWLVATVLLTSCESREREPAEGPPSGPMAGDERVSNPVQPSGEHDSSEGANRVIVFLGNSLASGYGIDPDAAFPMLVQQRIDSLGWNFRVVNAGLSGDTSAGGLRRIDWLLRQRVHVLVLELGGNDGLRGVDTEVTKRNLQGIIDRVRERYPDVRIVLAGMQIPPNLGHEYTERFRRIYPELAAENDVDLIPFLLEGVGGMDEMMLRDGIHPTERGHRLVAENVWEVLAPILEEMRDTA